MAVKFKLFLAVIIVTQFEVSLLFQVSMANNCVEFAKEGEVQYESLTRTLKFSLKFSEDLCSNNQLKFLRVDVTSPGNPKLLCNIVTKNGTCAPSDACTCNSPTRYQVRWQVADASKNETWRLSATLKDGSTFLVTVGVQGSKGDNGNHNRPTAEPNIRSPAPRKTTPVSSEHANSGDEDEKPKPTIAETASKDGVETEDTKEINNEDRNKVDPKKKDEETNVKQEPEGITTVSLTSGFVLLMLGSIAGPLIIIIVVVIVVCKLKGRFGVVYHNQRVVLPTPMENTYRPAGSTESLDVISIISRPPRDRPPQPIPAASASNCSASQDTLHSLDVDFGYEDVDFVLSKNQPRTRPVQIAVPPRFHSLEVCSPAWEGGLTVVSTKSSDDSD